MHKACSISVASCAAWAELGENSVSLDLLNTTDHVELSNRTHMTSSTFSDSRGTRFLLDWARPGVPTRPQSSLVILPLRGGQHDQSALCVRSIGPYGSRYGAPTPAVAVLPPSCNRRTLVPVTCRCSDMHNLHATSEAAATQLPSQQCQPGRGQSAGMESGACGALAPTGTVAPAGASN